MKPMNRIQKEQRPHPLIQILALPAELIEPFTLFDQLADRKARAEPVDETN